MSCVGYLTDERAWSRALTEAKSLETLRAVVSGWMPFVRDAQAVVEQMGERDFQQFRVGLMDERRGVFAGETWARQFGAVIMPETLIHATLMAQQFGVPLGTALLRMQQEGKVA